jgi:HPt (histidine-containing phosphotransfer) domain-containing protein
MTRERYAERIDFTSGLSDRLARIRCALEQLRQRPEDACLFAETHNSLQEVAGRAESFGLEELNEIGMRLDQALLSWRGRGAPAAAWAAVASADAALADFEDRLAPGALAIPWRMVRAGV